MQGNITEGIARIKINSVLRGRTVLQRKLYIYSFINPGGRYIIFNFIPG